MPTPAKAHMKSGGNVINQVRQAELAKAQAKVHALNCGGSRQVRDVVLNGNQLEVTGACCDKFKDEAKRLIVKR